MVYCLTTKLAMERNYNIDLSSVQVKWSYLFWFLRNHSLLLSKLPTLGLLTNLFSKYEVRYEYFKVPI